MEETGVLVNLTLISRVLPDFEPSRFLEAFCAIILPSESEISEAQACDRQSLESATMCRPGRSGRGTNLLLVPTPSEPVDRSRFEAPARNKHIQSRRVGSAHRKGPSASGCISNGQTPNVVCSPTIARDWRRR
jgi:hypothetical protein